MLRNCIKMAIVVEFVIANIAQGHGQAITRVQHKRRFPVPGIDYPVYREIPQTPFQCWEQQYHPGFYADVETNCQVFHSCFNHRQESFLCPPGTTFNQAILSCDYWYSSNCSLAPLFYGVNSMRARDDVKEIIRFDETRDKVSKFLEDNGSPQYPEVFDKIVDLFVPIPQSENAERSKRADYDGENNFDGEQMDSDNLIDQESKGNFGHENDSHEPDIEQIKLYINSDTPNERPMTSENANKGTSGYENFIKGVEKLGDIFRSPENTEHSKRADYDENDSDTEQAGSETTDDIFESDLYESDNGQKEFYIDPDTPNGSHLEDPTFYQNLIDRVQNFDIDPDLVSQSDFSLELISPETVEFSSKTDIYSDRESELFPSIYSNGEATHEDNYDGWDIRKVDGTDEDIMLPIYTNQENAFSDVQPPSPDEFLRRIMTDDTDLNSSKRTRRKPMYVSTVETTTEITIPSRTGKRPKLYSIGERRTEYGKHSDSTTVASIISTTVETAPVRKRPKLYAVDETPTESTKHPETSTMATTTSTKVEIEPVRKRPKLHAIDKPNVSAKHPETSTIFTTTSTVPVRKRPKLYAIDIPNVSTKHPETSTISTTKSTVPVRKRPKLHAIDIKTTDSESTTIHVSTSEEAEILPVKIYTVDVAPTKSSISEVITSTPEAQTMNDVTSKTKRPKIYVLDEPTSTVTPEELISEIAANHLISVVESNFQQSTDYQHTTDISSTTEVVTEAEVTGNQVLSTQPVFEESATDSQLAQTEIAASKSKFEISSNLFSSSNPESGPIDSIDIQNSNLVDESTVLTDPDGTDIKFKDPSPVFGADFKSTSELSSSEGYGDGPQEVHDSFKEHEVKITESEKVTKSNLRTVPLKIDQGFMLPYPKIPSYNELFSKQSPYAQTSNRNIQSSLNFKPSPEKTPESYKRTESRVSPLKTFTNTFLAAKKFKFSVLKSYLQLLHGRNT